MNGNISRHCLKKAIIVILCFAMMVVLASCYMTKEKDEAINFQYFESFRKGEILGIYNHIFSSYHQIGVIEDNEYANFSNARAKFYEDPSKANFTELVEVIRKNVNLSEIEYGEDAEAFAEGCFEGETRTNIEAMYRNNGISQDLYEEYQRELLELLQNPSHERANRYFEYMQDKKNSSEEKTDERISY